MISTIERVTMAKQCETCRELAEEIWGSEDRCSTPQMMVHALYGGILLLAKTKGRPVGFLLSFPSLYQGELVLWSHETGILPDFDQQGIGTKLKMEQKRLAFELGYRNILWTFDPLVSRNAHFNLNKLGAFITEYKENVYGIMKEDHLNRELPTDRFIVTWPVRAVGSKESSEKKVMNPLVILDIDEANKPKVHNTPEKGVSYTVATKIPSNIDVLLIQKSRIAQLWRQAFRKTALQLINNGYGIKRFYHSAYENAYIWELNEVHQ